MIFLALLLLCPTAYTVELEVNAGGESFIDRIVHRMKEFAGHYVIHGKHPVNLVHEKSFDHIPKLKAYHFKQHKHDPKHSNGIVDLRPKMPPVFNQGLIGSCTAHALSAAYSHDEPSLIGSRLFIYYNERMLENTINEDGGALLSDGVEALHRYGVCHETLWPYSDDTRFREKPGEKCYEEAVKHEAASYHHVEQSEDAIKACLRTGLPVVLGIKLYSSFETDHVTKTGMVPIPNTTAEQVLGGHAVVMVGYDDNRRVWIMRNSWGTDWGDHGHFYLPYEYVLDSNLCPGDLWVISTASKAPVSDKPTVIKPHRKHVHHSKHHHY